MSIPFFSKRLSFESLKSQRMVSIFEGHVPTAFENLLYMCARPQQYLPTHMMFVIELGSKATLILMLFAKYSR